MCWVSKKQDIKIAEQDIPILKIMGRVYNNSNLVRSYFQDHLYMLNALEKSEIIKHLIDNIIIVYKALHSYSEKMKIKCLNNILYVYDKEGNYVARYDSSILVLVKGIIPKGSQYMENKNGEYVSNQLILKEVKSLV